MNGPAHWRTAQEMLAETENADAGTPRDALDLMLRFAELHFQAARVAAVVDASADMMPESVREDWQAAMAGKPAPEPRPHRSFGADDPAFQQEFNPSYPRGDAS